MSPSPARTRIRNSAAFTRNIEALQVCDRISSALPAEIIHDAFDGKKARIVAWIDGGGNIDAKFDGELSGIYAGATLLMLTSAYNHVPLVEVLLERQASVDLQANNGYTALIAAASNGHLVAVQRLLRAGADVRLRDDHGVTALQYTKEQAHDECALAIEKHIEI